MRDTRGRIDTVVGRDMDERVTALTFQALYPVYSLCTTLLRSPVAGQLFCNLPMWECRIDPIVGSSSFAPADYRRAVVSEA